MVCCRCPAFQCHRKRSGESSANVYEGVDVPQPTVVKPRKIYNHEPRWPVILALLAVGGLHLSLPEFLTVGPSWMLLVVVGVLLIPAIITHRMGRYEVNQIFGYLLCGTVTLAMVFSLGLLIQALPTHKQAPAELLRSAAALWVTNVLVFASWYWRLDAGGPNARSLREAHTEGAFLFPQMTQHGVSKESKAGIAWRPGFVDYLFLAFNTSTALSPTDTSVLSRWAKALMMVQATISLMTIVLLAARAVNIL